MAAGLSTGQILLFDVRSAKPLVVKDHQFGEKIHSIAFHDASRNIISADTKIVKVWNRDTGAPFTAIEPEYGINQVQEINLTLALTLTLTLTLSAEC